MEINDALIDRLQALAKLNFEGEEREQIKGDLERMLDFVGSLSEVDTEGVEPLLYLSDEVNRLRPDKVVQELSQAEILKNSPSKDAYYFKVPKVIKG